MSSHDESANRRHIDVHSNHASHEGRRLTTGGKQETHHSHSGSRQVTAASGLPDLAEGMRVISDDIIEREVALKKKIILEEVIEKVVVVPETIQREDVIDKTTKVRERVIKISKPVVVTKTVEVPEYQYVEKLIEVPVINYVDRVRTEPKYVDRVVEVKVPKIVKQQKIVEVPVIEYEDYDVVKEVEVDQIEEKIVTREIPVPQVVERAVTVYVDVERPEVIQRKIPVPVEATTTYEFQLPQLRPRYTRKQMNIYAPRFVEVPVPAELMDEALQRQAQQLQEQVHVLSTQRAPSLAEIEKIAEYVKNNDFQQHIHASNFQHAIQSAWRSGSLQIHPENTGGSAQQASSHGSRRSNGRHASHASRHSHQASAAAH